MPRQARIDYPNYWYHITARGQQKKNIFLEEEDYITYLNFLDTFLQKYNALCGAFCLLPNHLHLLIYRNEHSLGDIFKKVHMHYALYFNKKYNKRGYVFQDRFFSKIILNEKYLITLIHYLHYTNPVEAHLSKSASGYKWSSDLFYRKRKEFNFIKLTPVPGFDGKEGIIKYKEIISKSKSFYKTLPMKKNYIGEEEEFKKLEKRTRITNDIARKNRRELKNIDKRISELCQKYNVDIDFIKSNIKVKDIVEIRSQIIYTLCKEGYSLTKIANKLNKNRATIINSFKRIKDKNPTKLTK